MSTSSEIVDSGRFFGHKMARAADKSTFSQTCSLLSQYLKEKGTFGDLNLALACSFDSNSKPTTPRQAGTPVAPTTINLFPQKSGFNSSLVEEKVPIETDLSATKSEPASAPMTIFYGGQVITFNDFPADKVKEIIQLASQSSSRTLNSFAPNFHSNSLQAHIQGPLQQQPVVSDLPIARKASLARFLEKRKDRIIARAPYQTSSNSTPPSSKPDERKLWLGLAATSPLPF